MGKDKKAIVAGHICIDITPVFPEKRVSDLSKILRFSYGEVAD